MRKAIGIPYCCNQNEPSVPLKKLIDIPDDIQQRNKLLLQLFNEHVCDMSDLDDDEKEEVRITESSKGYGDIIVSYGDDVFLYVTFIEEDKQLPNAVMWLAVGEQNIFLVTSGGLLEENWSHDPDYTPIVTEGQFIAYDGCDQFLGIYDTLDQAVQAQLDWCNET